MSLALGVMLGICSAAPQGGDDVFSVRAVPGVEGRGPRILLEGVLEERERLMDLNGQYWRRFFLPSERPPPLVGQPVLDRRPGRVEEVRQGSEDRHGGLATEDAHQNGLGRRGGRQQVKRAKL